MTRLARTVPVLGVLLAAALLIPSLVSAQHFPEDEDLAVMLRYLVEDGETPGIVLGVMERDGSSVRRASKISGRTPPPREVAGNAREQGLAVTAEDMARYAGTYALQGLPAPVELRMWGRNGVLMAQTPPQNEEPLIRTGENTFALSDNTNIRLVFDVVEGRAVRATLPMGGRAIPGIRKR